MDESIATSKEELREGSNARLPSPPSLDAPLSRESPVSSLLKPPKMLKFTQAEQNSRLEINSMIHRAARSESSLSLGSLKQLQSRTIDSDALLLRQRADSLWNQEKYQRLALLESERERTVAQVFALEQQLASSQRELQEAKVQSAEAVAKAQKELERGDTEFHDATEYAKRQLTRDGWDMENLQGLFEFQSKTERIAQLEVELSNSSKKLIKNEKEIVALQTRVKKLNRATGDLRLLAYHDVSASESYHETGIPGFLREWAIQACLMRCIVALTAGKFAKAEMHSSEALKLCILEKKVNLTAECQYWHGVALCGVGRFQEAVEPLRMAGSGSEMRRKQAREWFLLARSRSNDLTQTNSPHFKRIVDGNYSDGPTSPACIIKAPSFSASVRSETFASRQRPKAQLTLSLKDANDRAAQLKSPQAPPTTANNLNFSSVSEEDEGDVITPRAPKQLLELSINHKDTYGSPARTQRVFNAQSSTASTISSHSSRSRHMRWPSDLSTAPTLVADSDTDATSLGNSSPEPPFDGQTFASIDELIQPHIVVLPSLQSSPQISPPDGLDLASSNKLLCTPKSLIARRKAANEKITNWRLQVPVQHRDALGVLSRLPSAKRSAFPRPGHESPPTPPTSFSPEESSPMHLRRSSSWGDVRSMERGLGKSKKFAEGEAAKTVKLARHLARRKESAREVR